MTVQEIVVQRDLLGSRWIAAWVDYIGSFGILVVGEILLGNALYRATAAFWLLLAIAYFPVLEATTGRTLGRLVTGTIVVDKDGNIPGFRRALIRTLARLIEVNPILIGGLPAGIAVLTTRHHQRVGDIWAGTYVLRVSERRETLATGASEPTPLV